jgi:hypothetical protein
MPEVLNNETTVSFSRRHLLHRLIEIQLTTKRNNSIKSLQHFMKQMSVFPMIKQWRICGVGWQWNQIWNYDKREVWCESNSDIRSLSECRLPIHNLLPMQLSSYQNIYGKGTRTSNYSCCIPFYVNITKRWNTCFANPATVVFPIL